MARHVLLNNVEHKNLRVNTRSENQYASVTGSVITVPTEFADVQREYPIFFRKDPNSGEYTAIALLGFTRDENLYLEGGRWDAAYIPGIIARGPFLIGFQERQDGSELRREPVIHVDMEDARISQTEGELVFLENGGNTRYLEHIANVLQGLNDGIAASKAMFDAFKALDLIEPLKLEIKVGAKQYDVLGLHTISARKLRELNAEQVYGLHRSGLLQGAYLVLSSLNNIQRLIDRKTRRERAQGEMAS